MDNEINMRNKYCKYNIKSGYKIQLAGCRPPGLVTNMAEEKKSGLP